MAAPTGTSPTLPGGPAAGPGTGFKKYFEDLWTQLGTTDAVRWYTTQGSYTWTKPAGLRAVLVRAVGGGGGGGGCTSSTANQSAAGAGGQAGSYAEAIIPASALPASVAVTVGQGGAGGVGAASGATGSTTSFGSFVTCPGGAGGGTVASSTTHGSVVGQTAGGLPASVTGQSGDAITRPGARSTVATRVSNGTTAVFAGASCGGASPINGWFGIWAVNGNGGGGAYGSGGGGCESRAGGSFNGGVGGDGEVVIVELY